MIRFISLICAAALLAGCDTPKVGFKHTGVKELSVRVHKFKVYYNDTDAQSIRLNNVKLRQRQDGADASLQAIELATGCKIKRVDKTSDAVLTIARIKCPK